MERVCTQCGKIAQSETDECPNCGASYNTPIEVVSDVIEVPCGVKLQTVALMSFIIALCNIVIGPIVTVITVFSPLFPTKLFDTISFKVWFFAATAVPMIAVLCLFLNSIAKRSYKQEQHAPKNHRLFLVSYRLSVCAVLVWLLIFIGGVLITFL